MRKLRVAVAALALTVGLAGGVAPAAAGPLEPVADLWNSSTASIWAECAARGGWVESFNIGGEWFNYCFVWVNR